jgi:hypothetical protein
VRVEAHAEILRYRNDGIRFKVVHAGRRSFKTEIAKRTLVAEALTTPNQSLFFGAPTRDQAKRIAWEDLKLLSPKWSIKSVSETELHVRYANGSEIWVLGFDKPERFEGKRWNGGVLDEYGNMQEKVWNETVAPALRDTYGWCWLIGVPEGKNHYFELSHYARTEQDAEWGDYCWFTTDVMDPKEVEKERKRLDERTFRQEYEGSFESYEGRAYVYYDVDIHRAVLPFDPHLPVCLCLDFNIDPFLVEFAQDNYRLTKGTGTYFFDEIKYRQADTWAVCAEAKRRLDLLLGSGAKTHKLLFYGDYTSSARRDASAIGSSWQIVRDCFVGYNAEFRLRGNPRILDRVNAFNSRLRSAAGAVCVQFHPNCVELMKDLEMVDMEMLTTAKGQAGDRTHASDAAGYMINYEYPVMGGPTGRVISR